MARSRRRRKAAAKAARQGQPVAPTCTCPANEVFHRRDCPRYAYDRGKRKPLLKLPEHSTLHVATDIAKTISFAQCSACGCSISVTAKGRLPRCPEGCGNTLARVAMPGAAQTMAHTWTHVDELADCDICKLVEQQFPGLYTIGKARVDGRTNKGPWAKMCVSHYLVYGVGLGLGKGQYLLLPGEEVPNWVPKR